MPFPEGSSDDALDELHADLARWDSFVADLVIPLLSGRQVEAGVVDIGAGLRELLSELESLRAKGGAAEVVDAYERYALGLLDVYEAASDEARGG